MIMKSDCNKVKFDEIRLVEKQINTYDFCFLIKLMTLNIVEDILQEDVLFSSPSGAAMFVVGKSANGLTSWKNADGITLKDIESDETK